VEEFFMDSSSKSIQDMAKILIVDDHPIFRMGMTELLNQEEDLEVCALAEDIRSARKALEEEVPDLAVVDISLAADNGLDLVKEIVSGGRNIPVLVLSMHDESVWAERAIRAGARGFVMKKEASELIVTAIRKILKGKIHISENMMSHLLDKFQLNPKSQNVPLENSLTDRELDVYGYIGGGLSTREIAEKMHLSMKTIGSYRDRIKQKLGCKTAAELVRSAVLYAEKENFGRNNSWIVGKISTGE
jgi:DNA-binding NarL/FixJ family response regulator